MEGQAERARRRPWDPPGWGSFWRAGLLAASILSSAFLLTQAQSPTTNYNISIFMNPPEALEGQEINLTLKHASVTFFVCNWYRETEIKENLIVTAYLPPLDGNTFGPAYTKRETPGFNCSLLIVNLHPNDSGNYIVTKSGPSVSGRGLVNIQVLEAIKNITISHPGKIFETNTTHLNCTASGSNVSYYWLKGNQSLEVTEHIFLSSNGQNLTLKPTKRQDSNRYTCFGNNSFSSNFTSYTLNVLYGPDAPVISPSVQFYAESSNLTLSCRADSNPAANYTWYFKNSTYPGKTFQIFNLSSVHNGSYKCEAYNNETKLSRSKIQPVCVLAPSPSTTPLFGILTGSVPR